MSKCQHCNQEITYKITQQKIANGEEYLIWECTECEKVLAITKNKDAPLKPTRESITHEIIEHIYQAESPYWSAFLAFEGVFMAVFSFIAFQYKPHIELVCIASIAVCSGLVCSILMIFNFASRLTMFVKQGKLFSPYEPIPDDIYERLLKHSTEENKERETRTLNVKIAYYLFVLQAGIIFAFLLLTTKILSYNF